MAPTIRTGALTVDTVARMIGASSGGLKKKKLMHRIGLHPPVAPPLAIIRAPHDNYSGIDKMLTDTPTRYES
jgi:hypothetical protein